jgi:hypothetical protein
MVSGEHLVAQVLIRGQARVQARNALAGLLRRDITVPVRKPWSTYVDLDSSRPVTSWSGKRAAHSRRRISVSSESGPRTACARRRAVA